MGNNQIQTIISESKGVEQTKQEEDESHHYNKKVVKMSDRIQQIKLSEPEVQPQAEENFLKDIYNSNKKSAPLPCYALQKEFRHHPNALGQNYQSNKSKLQKVVCTNKLVIDKNQNINSMNEAQTKKNKTSMGKISYQCTVEDIQSENNERILL